MHDLGARSDQLVGDRPAVRVGEVDVGQGVVPGRTSVNSVYR